MTSVVARGRMMYAKVSRRRGRTSCVLRSGITSVRRRPDGQYKISFPASANPPLGVVAVVDGKDAERRCLGVVAVASGGAVVASDGGDDGESIVYSLGQIPRFLITVSFGPSRGGKYDHVLVSAWRQPTVKTLAAARRARPRRGRCDFMMQIFWR